MIRFILLVGIALSGCASSGAIDEAGVKAWQADVGAFFDVLESEHDDPYFFTPKATQDNKKQVYLKTLPSLSQDRRIVRFAELVSMVGDGHTWMPLYPIPFEGVPPGPQFHPLPIRFELFDDGLFIVGAVPAYVDFVGARVVSFGDTPAQAAIEKVMTLLPQDATRFSAEFAPEWLMLAEILSSLSIAESAGAIPLTVQKGETLQTTMVEPLPLGWRYDWIMSMDTGPANQEGEMAGWKKAALQSPLWREGFQAPWRLQKLENAIYVQVNQIRDQADKTFSRLGAEAVERASVLEKPAIIIDLRRAIGGNGNLNQDFVKAIRENKTLNKRGRIVVLTSRQTHSAAIMLVSALEQQTEAIFIGQPTADRPNHHGETNIFVLPNNKLPVLYASEYYQTSDAGDARPYRSPDIEIPYLFENYKSGHDPVLAKAISLISGE